VKQVKEDLKRLRDLPKTGEVVLGEDSVFKTDFQLESKGNRKVKRWNILGHGKVEEKIQATTDMHLKSGKRQSVTLTQRNTNEYSGMTSVDSHLPFRDLTTKRAQRVLLNVEIDNFDPIHKFGIFLRVMDFRRYANRAELDSIIRELNRRFSKNSSTPFYSGEFEIPDSTEVDEFRKIYAISFVMLNGTEFLEKLMAISKEDLEERVRRFRTRADSVLEKSSEEGQKSGSRITDAKDRIATHFEVKNLLDDYDQLKVFYQRLGNLRVLQATNERNDPQAFHKVYEELSKKLERFFTHLELNVFGVQFLKELLGENSLLVMGTIDGVLPAYSALQSLQERQQCRYIADGAWGKWNAVLPVLYLNRFGRYSYKSILLGNQVSLDHFFGRIETTQPEELKPKAW
jgi:hypothetical protein